MIAARTPRRSGITLTEILIAILIMAVGLISLATLFPLGLVRLQEASRLSRAGLAVRTAADDTDTRALLYKPSFLNTWYGGRDPFVQDMMANGDYNTANTLGSGVIASGSLFLPNNNVSAGNSYYDASGTLQPSFDGFEVGPLTSGLPFCYDPLWRAITGVAPVCALSNGTLLADSNLDCQPNYLNTAVVSGTLYGNEARFGSALFGGTAPFIHDGGDANVDPDKSVVSAHGLQRLTNFIPFSTAGQTPFYGFTYSNPVLASDAQPADVSGNTFTSIDDVVFHEVGSNIRQFPFSTTQSATPFSSLVPFIDPQSKTTQADYRYTWFFTGRQADANGNGAQFTGEIVVCDGRPFSFDPVPGVTGFAPAGETVVEAIYGYNRNTRAVLLRWRNTLADPRVRTGGWIADTTYERSVSLYRSRATGPSPPATSTPFVRCNWYQVAKRTDPAPDPTYPTTHRSVVVTLTAPVKVATPFVGQVTAAVGDDAPGVALHQNVALIMPSVINVFPRSFEVH